jgi:hypothetical protein
MVSVHHRAINYSKQKCGLKVTITMTWIVIEISHGNSLREIHCFHTVLCLTFFSGTNLNTPENTRHIIQDIKNI